MSLEKERIPDGEINPVTRMDYPDPDVIRVEDTYYMVTTTMHFMPGCEILRSYDLVNWEHFTYVYDRLDSTPEQKLVDGDIYGKGMWAASLREHGGKFYICFVANDTGKTYLYTADRLDGEWKKQYLEGFYHDPSLLFDDDGKVYIAYGNTEIHITELEADLSKPKQGGIDRIAVVDKGNSRLGYEGAHFYKINGKYYLFLIHSLQDRWRRVEACFVADTIDGAFTGGDVFDCDRGYCDQGVAQGGVVSDPQGNWYGMLFQDSGAVGRIPILVPVDFSGRMPVFGVQGELPLQFQVPEKNGHIYGELTASDDFKMAGEEKRLFGCFGLKSAWQFNHEPDLGLLDWDRNAGQIRIRTDKLSKDVTMAKNTLTQRMRYPGCSAEVTLDFSRLANGDCAGLCALQGQYGWIGVTKRDNRFYVVVRTKHDDAESEEVIRQISGESIRLRLDADFTDMKDEVCFYEKESYFWNKVGKTHKLTFGLDHFTGCRFGLFVYATQQIGGEAAFSDFRYIAR